MYARMFLFFLFGLLSNDVFAQKEKAAYEQAFQSLSNMLSGKQTLDFSKAVFICENAHHNGSLKYEDYQKQIKQIAATCRTMIENKKLQNFKTAGNWALFTWMTQKIPENNQQPCTYDFEDFLGKNTYANVLVWRLLKDKKGNCVSLPLLYKMVAQELKIEAKLALGPNHVWIRHIDEYGKWANLELTSGQLLSDGLVMTELGITSEAIRSGAYGTALTEKQSIAFLLTRLIDSYENKFERLDAFTEKCADLSIKHFPPNIVAYIYKSRYQIQQIKKVQALTGTTRSPETDKMYAVYQQYEKKLTALGASDIKPEEYNDWVRETLKNKK